MKPHFLIMIFVALLTNCFAQGEAVIDDRAECVPFNYITIVNGELPQYTSTILRYQKDCITDTIVCDFRYSQLIQSSHAMTELCSLIPDTTLVFVEYHYEEPINQMDYKLHTYKDTLYWSAFKSIEVVCINDLNTNKHTYYIYYKLQPPWYRHIAYNKKFHVSKRRFGRKIFRGLAPTRNSIYDKTVY